MIHPARQKTASIQYGDIEIDFAIEPRATDTPKVLIKVHPDCRVVVHAPPLASAEEIIQAVKKRVRWIHRQIRYFEEQRKDILPRRYVSGESHFYLGRRHVLKIQEALRTAPEVKMLRGVLEVKTRVSKPEKIRSLLFDWYKAKAREVFDRRLDEILLQTLWVKEKPPIRLLSMQTQWGSCSPKGQLTLNPHLVKAPRECIDYVLLHELCHIAEHNHSENFYRLMKQVMPHWEKVKGRLDGMAYFYLNDV
ncbi:SprT family zinc-dependent metalloprotease [Nitrosomonas communis]|uniref:M48 family metallopeptidase n=1 Tax=Nitrosomonas communis TaxID=44574 RepID=UPI0026F0E3BF|nr:SprT family zinc-dependent metalloprotease [Nitrosomonas communis]MCO6427675.1 M48 family metallopeptidase [Nitrosomonas communis]